MNLGLIVRADKTGLGIQTKAYYDHLQPKKTLVVDISSINGNQQFYGWYRDAYFHKGMLNLGAIDQFLTGLDVVLTAETSYGRDLYFRAKQRGVKVATVINPEFFDWWQVPDFPLPDLFILPSVWLQDEIKQFARERGVKVVQLHHPVDREQFPFIQRKHGKPFHNAGKPATLDRNGTMLFMQAVPNGTVTTQSLELAQKIREAYPRSNVWHDIANVEDIYKKGDIMVLPRKYGGNCLPLNEALSSGCPVIMPDISPNNHLLPKEWLVPAKPETTFRPRLNKEITVYTCDPSDIVERIDYVKKNIQVESVKASEIADTISWETMKDKWLEALCAF